jgi:hypothetical protein
MTKETSLERIANNLFKSKDEQIELTSAEQEIKKRLLSGYTQMLENPTETHSNLVNFLMNEFGISKSQAYRDIENIKYLLGNVKNASKEWYRHMVIEMCKKAYAIAESNQDAKGMALAADKIGKYTKLDKDEIEEIPWDELIPPDFEPSEDITLLKLEPIQNKKEYIARIMRKLGENPQDIEYEEVKE